MAYDRRVRVLAEGLCCPRCGHEVAVEALDAHPTIWQAATYKVSCTAGDYRVIVSGRVLRELEGVALKAV